MINIKKVIKNIPIIAIMLLILGFYPINSNASNTGYRITQDYKVVPNDPKGNKKVVLLTIDDGPTKQSENIVKILDKENVKVIFFINGINVKNYPNALKMEVKSGHAIGNHTWSHKNLKKIKDTDAQKELEKTNEIIKKETGTLPRFFRAPFGVNSTFSKLYIKKNKMISMNWTNSPLDWEKASRNKKVFIANVMKNLSPGSIILMHEHTWSRDALPELITTLKNKGYTFVDPKDIH